MAGERGEAKNTVPPPSSMLAGDVPDPGLVGGSAKRICGHDCEYSGGFTLFLEID
jgi:hypothetical protein